MGGFSMRQFSNLMRLSVLGLFCLSLTPAAAFAADRETAVPNNFINGYVGFASVNNTDVTVSGTKSSSWIGRGSPERNFTVDLKDLNQQNAIWGGFAVGHWFKQAPISFGLSGSMDFYPTTINEQTKTNVPFTLNGAPGTFTTFTKYETRVFQMVPAFNLIGGIPLKFFRVYAGVGPGIFASFYSFTLKNAAGQEVGNVTASDVKVGYQAFVGLDFFITRRLSAFVEGKYSQVNNLTFTPDPNDPLVAGRDVSDEYKSIITKRLGVGLSFHF
jgi:opacity protein-like surface antigen